MGIVKKEEDLVLFRQLTRKRRKNYMNIL